MSREFARRVGPRGNGPDTFRREVERVKNYNTPVPQHTPGSQCGECRPQPCSVAGCKGWAHKLQLTFARICGTCGARS